MPNRRRFSRVPFSTVCIIKHNETTYPVSLIDISLKGALIHTDTILPLQKGDETQFILALDDNETRLVFAADVAHIEADHYGIHFRSTDINSMIHLRRLLEVNLCDPDRLVSELGTMVHADE